MSQTPSWPEVESKVHQPARWIVLLFGALLIAMGAIGFLTLGAVAAPGLPPWVAPAACSVILLLGLVIIGLSIREHFRPIYIRHVRADSLADLSAEPVLREGSVVFGRQTHELIEEADGWKFRPQSSLQRHDQLFLLAFGAPFVVIFAAFLTWVIHQQLNAARWLVSAAIGTTATVLSGGTVLGLIAMVMRASYRALTHLTIPLSGELQLDTPVEPKLQESDLVEGLKAIFFGKVTRERRSIARESVMGVQLCPWKLVLGGSRNKSTACAVQGLLVLAGSETSYERIPILLTSDYVGAARIMQQLGEVLNVPYFFCADADGWKAELIRAKNRPPIMSGGMQS